MKGLESEQVVRNGDLKDESRDEDGFQRVLSSSERRVLRKRGEVRRLTLAECNSLESSLVSRLKKRGLDPSADAGHSSVESCSLEPGEVPALIAELDEAILGVLCGVEKPDQSLSVAELEAKIRLARSNLAQLKAKKRGSALTKEELDRASQETEVYVAYLQGQIALTREYQKLKSAQSSLIRLKSLLTQYLSDKLRLAKYNNHTAQNNHTTQPDKNAKSDRDSDKVDKPDKVRDRGGDKVKVLGSTRRTVDYVYEFIREMKGDFAKDELTSRDFRLEDGSKFLPPYSFLQKLRQRFRVFVDKSGTKPLVLAIYGSRDDVDACVDFLSSLDLSSEHKVSTAFSKYRSLLDAEKKYNVLLSYNSGSMYVLGSDSDVHSFLSHVNSDSGRQSDDNAPVSDNDRLYDYYVVRALSGKFRPSVRDLEAEYGVGIKFDLTPRNGLAKVSFVPLLNNTVEPCVEHFSSYVGEYAYRDLGKLSGEELSFLGDNDVLRKRYRSQHTTLVRVGDKVFVVGLKKYLNFGFTRAQLLLESRLSPPYKFKLTAPQHKLLTPHLSSLQDQIGVYIATNSSASTSEHESAEGGSTLLIYGNGAQQKECISALNDMLKTYCTCDVLLNPVKHSLVCDRIHELENRFRVKASLTKSVLSLSGPKPQVESLVQELKASFDKVVYLTLDDTVPEFGKELVHAVVFVPPKSLGKVIGRGGATLKHILLRSSLDQLIITKATAQPHHTANSVDEVSTTQPGDAVDTVQPDHAVKQGDAVKEVDVLLMVGTGSSVVYTLGLVKRVLDSEDDVLLKGDSRNLYDEYTSRHSIMRKTNSNYTSSTSSSSRYKSEEKLDINDLDNFPSL